MGRWSHLLTPSMFDFGHLAFRDQVLHLVCSSSRSTDWALSNWSCIGPSGCDLGREVFKTSGPLGLQGGDFLWERYIAELVGMHVQQC
jgi:hypothetical protein